MFPQINITYDDYTVNEFLNKLPGYDSSEGVDSLLELSRIINESGNYYWVGVPFPDIPTANGAQPTNLPANSTINGTIALPPGTYVTAINYFFSLERGSNYGLKFRLYDKGTKASIFYGDYALDQLVMSQMPSNLTQDVPFGPGYLKSPFIITPPGNLNWEIVNLAPQDVLAQIFVTCAVPINNRSLNTRRIEKGTN